MLCNNINFCSHYSDRYINEHKYVKLLFEQNGIAVKLKSVKIQYFTINEFAKLPTFTEISSSPKIFGPTILTIKEK